MVTDLCTLEPCVPSPLLDSLPCIARSCLSDVYILSSLPRMLPSSPNLSSFTRKLSQEGGQPFLFPWDRGVFKPGQSRASLDSWSPYTWVSFCLAFFFLLEAFPDPLLPQAVISISPLSSPLPPFTLSSPPPSCCHPSHSPNYWDEIYLPCYPQ